MTIMATNQMGAIIIAAASLILALWYLRANSRWIQLLRRQDPSLSVDPVSSPLEWLGSVPSRMSLELSALLNPSSDEQLEKWRRLTVNRFIICASMVPLLLFLGPVVTYVTEAFFETIMARDGATFGLAMFGVAVFILVYWLCRLVYAIYRFGNGVAVKRAEFVVGLFGIASYTLIITIVSQTPLGPMR